jgi:hypothetical protein
MLLQRGRRQRLGCGAVELLAEGEAVGCGVFQGKPAGARCEAHLGRGRLSRRNRMSGTGRIQLATMRQMVAILRGSMIAGDGGVAGGGGREEAARRCSTRGRRCWSNRQVRAGL